MDILTLTGVSNWLTVLPVTEIGFELSEQQFWDLGFNKTSIWLGKHAIYKPLVFLVVTLISSAVWVAKT